jgi:ParB family transcriptional regulator, chromosome partitioning protein
VPLASKRAPQTFDDLVRVREVVKAVDDRIVHLVPVADIRPSAHNPRHALEGITELAASIAEHGLLQAVVVRRVAPDGYELIAGHRRLEAAKALGWTEIAAAVRDETDEQAYILTLVENLQREDLSPREEAGALEVLVRERGWTTRQVGEAIKRSPMYVSRRLRVFDDPLLAPLVLRGDVAVSTAEELLRAPEQFRPQLAAVAATEKWTPAKARRQVAAAGCNESLQRQEPALRLPSRLRALSDELAHIDAKTLNVRTRRELARLIKVAQAVAESARSTSAQ